MRPLALAAVATWLVYAAVYALVFAFAGSPIRLALMGAVANALPDALVACAAIVASRRADRRLAPTASLVRLHASVAVVVMILGAAGKALLLWFDIVVLNGQPYQIVSSIVPWHLFLSGVVYVAVASMSHAWLIARRLREEEAHAARVEALRARAEMAALRAQLNPHFLFNTLHSVMGLVRRDPALAETALEKLGDLLHYATRVHRDAVDWTSLRQEWEFARTYLDLESIRLGERLQVVRRADDDAWDQRVPTFSIQPLVENAVRHGVAPRAAGGRISIDARLDQAHLRIDVSNDGAGHTTQAPPDAGEGGLGLRVLRERLETLYRGAAGITVGETITGGYRVVLTLPLTDANGEVRP